MKELAEDGLHSCEQTGRNTMFIHGRHGGSRDDLEEIIKTTHPTPVPTRYAKVALTTQSHIESFHHKS